MTDSENIKVVPAPNCQSCKYFTFWDEVVTVNHATQDIGHCEFKETYSGYTKTYIRGLVAANYTCNDYEYEEEDVKE